MTFSASVPLNSDTPAIFPAQNQGNMAVLRAIVARDHQFNNTPNASPPTDNTGYHNLINMTIQAPSGALASTGRLYVKDVAGSIYPFYMDATGTAQQIAGKFSSATTGYSTLPGGLIMQWGKITSTSITAPVLFPTPFTTLFNVQMTITISAGSTTSHSGSVYVLDGATFLPTGFTWRQVDRSSDQTGFYWVALGN